MRVVHDSREGVGRVGGLMMPVDTGNQVVCTVGQTDGHSSPDHTMRRAEGLTGNSIKLSNTTHTKPP